MNKNKHLRAVCATGILSALAFVLMMIEIPLSFIIPSFIKLDFSELPALIASFAYGPVWGVAVCLLKNLMHLPIGTTGGVGELSNFLLGAVFVFIAGLIYKIHKSKKSAFLGSALGAVVMAVIGIFTNYYIVYPIYTAFMPMEAIIGMYQAILPSVDNLWEALIIFNTPFNIFKGLLDTLICMLTYKKLTPILKGSSKI